MFHHDFLVPARVPGLVSLLFSFFFRNGIQFCFIMISLFRLGFRGLSPFFLLSQERDCIKGQKFTELQNTLENWVLLFGDAGILW